MNRSILFAILLVFTFHCLASDDSYKIKLFFLDGSIKIGLTKYAPEIDAKYIRFKISEKDKFEKIASNDLSRLTLYFNKDSVTYDHIKLYTGRSQKKINGPYWMKIVATGYASLYIMHTSLSMNSRSGSAMFLDYYIIRKNEDGAKLISTEATFNSNSVFKHYGVTYFADCPEIAQKIESKQYTYKDIQNVVKEYNLWIGTK